MRDIRCCKAAEADSGSSRAGLYPRPLNINKDDQTRSGRLLRVYTRRHMCSPGLGPLGRMHGGRTGLRQVSKKAGPF